MGRAEHSDRQPSNPPPLSATGLHALQVHLDALEHANHGLRAELERSHRQLGAIFEITRRTALLSDPLAIREAILDTYVQLFDAGRVLLATSHGVQPVRNDPSHPLPVGNDAVALALAAQIEAARAGRPVAAPATTLPDDFPHYLIGRLANGDGPAADVLIALRAATGAPFDHHDRLVSETVLVYGGHAINDARLARQEADGALETVLALANAIDARDAYTRGHSERVAWLAVQLGTVVGVSGPALQQLEWAGLLHDVGKIGVPEAILKKAEGLTREEYALIQEHARQGYEVLRPVRRLAGVAEAVLYHHENWDGSGYPYGIRGEQIPWMARVLRICDTFDAMTSGRSYRNQSSIELTLEELERVAGQACDPELAAAFVARLRVLHAQAPPEFRRRFGHALRHDQLAASESVLQEVAP